MATGLDNLKVYLMAVRLEVFCHKVLDLQFPRDERFRSIDQLKRSTSSVADNIAESYGKYYFQAQIHHLLIARGECEESRSGFFRAYKKGFISKNMASFVENKYTELIKGINGYIAFIRKRKTGKTSLTSLTD